MLHTSVLMDSPLCSSWPLGSEACPSCAWFLCILWKSTQAKLISSRKPSFPIFLQTSFSYSVPTTLWLVSLSVLLLQWSLLFTCSWEHRPCLMCISDSSGQHGMWHMVCGTPACSMVWGRRFGGGKKERIFLLNFLLRKITAGTEASGRGRAEGRGGGTCSQGVPSSEVGHSLRVGGQTFVDGEPGFSHLRRRSERDWIGKCKVLSAESSGRSNEERGSLSQWTWTFLPLSETLSQDSLGMCVHGQLLQSCLTLYNPKYCSLPDSSVHGILQAGILEWVAVPSSRGSSWPRDQTLLSLLHWEAGSFTTSATWEAPVTTQTSQSQPPAVEIPMWKGKQGWQKSEAWGAGRAEKCKEQLNQDETIPDMCSKSLRLPIPDLVWDFYHMTGSCSFFWRGRWWSLLKRFFAMAGGGGGQGIGSILLLRILSFGQIIDPNPSWGVGEMAFLDYLWGKK